jgi:microcystin-dependent protein
VSEPFVGELKLMSFDFPPRGWAHCNGQLLQINQNQPLFALLGTQYGGNGQTNFALPNLRGRVPIHRDAALPMGHQIGEDSHTLTPAEMPAHTHLVSASSQNGNQAGPKILAEVSNAYAAPSNLTSISPATITNVGGSQPHENRQPYLVLNWCIALQGIFPASSGS